VNEIHDRRMTSVCSSRVRFHHGKGIMEASHEMNATAIVESTVYLMIKATSNENVRARARQ